LFLVCGIWSVTLKGEWRQDLREGAEESIRVLEGSSARRLKKNA